MLSRDAPTGGGECVRCREQARAEQALADTRLQLEPWFDQFSPVEYGSRLGSALCNWRHIGVAW